MRVRLVSNITDATQVSTHHSDKTRGSSDELTVKKNFSNNDAETSNEETLSPIEKKREKLSKTPKNTLSTG